MGGLATGLGSKEALDGMPNFWSSESEQSKPDTSFPKTESKPSGYDDVLHDVATTYPALAPHTKNALVYDASRPSGTSEDTGLETYLPWEDWNPHPGKVTSEIYKPYSSREEARDAIAGDLIHMSGAVNPQTGKPVDPVYYKLKQQVKKSRTPEQRKIDYQAYKEDVQKGEDRSFDQWFNESRGEAYVRGRLFPDKNDEWKNFYEENPKLKKAVDRVGKYLRTGK